MKPKGRVMGDDVCNIVCPNGPPPTCLKLRCYEIYMHFAKGMAPEPEKKPTPKGKKS